MFLCFIFWDLLMLMLMYYYYCGVFQQSYLGNRALPNAAQQHTEPNRIVHTTFVSFLFYISYFEIWPENRMRCVFTSVHTYAWPGMRQWRISHILDRSAAPSSHHLFGCSLVFILLFQFVRVVFSSLFLFVGGSSTRAACLTYGDTENDMFL